MSTQSVVTYVSSVAAETAAVEQLTTQINIQFNSVSCIPDIYPLLSDPKFVTDLIVIDIEKFYEQPGVTVFDMISTLETLIRSTVCRVAPGRPVRRNTALVVAADTTTDPRLIKEILGTDIKGIYPRGNQFTANEKILAIQELLAGQLHVPKKIHTRNKPKPVARAAQSATVRLTTRQEQILSLIRERGASNKVIARMLDISESTVKLHITATLKKFGVRNRTQLANSANQQAQQEKT